MGRSPIGAGLMDRRLRAKQPVFTLQKDSRSVAEHRDLDINSDALELGWGGAAYVLHC